MEALRELVEHVVPLGMGNEETMDQEKRLRVAAAGLDRADARISHVHVPYFTRHGARVVRPRTRVDHGQGDMCDMVRKLLQPLRFFGAVRRGFLSPG